MDIRKHSEKFSIEDLEFIHQLLKTGMTIENALAVVLSGTNKKVIEKIEEELQKGQVIEKIISHYVPIGIDRYLSPLLINLPFYDALSLSLDFYKEEKENGNYLVKNVSYPLLLVFVSIVGLFMFDRMGLDSIISLMRGLNGDIQNVETIRLMIRCVVTLCVSLLFITVMLVLIASRKRYLLLSYELCSSLFKDSLWKSYSTNELVKFLLIACRYGHKTREALVLLRSITDKPILSFMAYRLDEKLLEGDSLEKAGEDMLFDPLFSRYLRISASSKDYIQLLENFVSLSRSRLERAMKKLTASMEVSVYILIGFIIVFVYQILFMPMQAISNF